MPVVEIMRDVQTKQVEFPEKVKEEGKQPRPLQRSCVGSLHLRPGVRVITVDEFAHIKRTDKDLFRKIRIISLTKEEKTAGVKLPQQAAPRLIPRGERRTSKKLERLAAEKRAREGRAVLTADDVKGSATADGPKSRAAVKKAAESPVDALLRSNEEAAERASEKAKRESEEADKAEAAKRAAEKREAEAKAKREADAAEKKAAAEARKAEEAEAAKKKTSKKTGGD